MQEKVKNLMNTLHITEEEALDIIKTDEMIDKGADPFPLTEEQKKVVKKAKNVDTKKVTTRKREKKENPEKQRILFDLQSGLQTINNLQVINNEREFTFESKGIKYKVVLSCPRT